MKIKLKQVLVEMDNITPIIVQGVDLTLKTIIGNSLLTPLMDKKDPSGAILVLGDNDKQKKEKYDLFTEKIRDCPAEEIDLEAKEIALIEKAIWDVQPTLIAGQSFAILEGKV